MKATPITFKTSALKQTFRADLTEGKHHKKFKDHSEDIFKEKEPVATNTEEKNESGITPPSDPPKDPNEENKGENNDVKVAEWLNSKGADGLTGQETLTNLQNLFGAGKFTGL
mgnify:CR=1 FL=1|tara:strand:- start:88 stop:426 length:339 start_codon:yes stop_codon:yes gene_type:complete